MYKKFYPNHCIFTGRYQPFKEHTLKGHRPCRFFVCLLLLILIYICKSHCSSFSVRFFSSRKCIAAEIMIKFNPLVPLTVHWDDKLLSDFTGHKSVDWLPAVAIVTEYNNCMACNRDRAGNATSIIHPKLDYYNLPKS